MRSDIQLPKITRPGFSGVFLRERLFRVLDDGRKQPVFWITGPAGSGKTTLTASYIEARGLPCLWYQMDGRDSDPAAFFYYMGLAAKKAAPRHRRPLPLLSTEYLQGLSIFARNFFENLYARLRSPFALILDNYQEVPADSILHELIKEGVSVLPEGINVMIISRTPPLKNFTRLWANKKVSYIGSDELRFSLEETKALVGTRELKEISNADMKRLHRKIEGWAAGLVLLLERWKSAGFTIESLETLKQDEIFDYFASEIFEKAGGEIQNFLLKTAFLPKMNSQMAGEVSGDKEAGRKLAYLSRNHYFTERHPLAVPVYQYHSMFRDFLITKARSSFSDEEQKRIGLSAAQILERSDMAEESALLYIELGRYEEFIRLMRGNAASMLQQGRNETLEKWIRLIPEDYIGASAWLLYWLGASRLPFDILESRSDFENAFELFKGREDTEGIYLSWAGVVTTYMYEWGDFRPLDRWISEMEKLLDRYPIFPTIDSEAQAVAGMYSALMFRRPQHQDFSKWQDRLRKLVQIIPDANYKLTIGSVLAIHYLIWFGDFGRAEEIINELQPVVRSGRIPPLTLINWYAMLAKYYWFTDAHKDCLIAVKKGMEIAASNGVHLLDSRMLREGALSYLTSCDYSSATKYLDKLSAVVNRCSHLDFAFYNHLLFIRSMHLKDVHRAVNHVRNAVDLAREAGMVFVETCFSVALALALIEKGEHEEAAGHLRTAKELAVSMNCPYIEYMCLICEAKSAFDKEGDEKGLLLLREALAIGREKQKFMNMCLFPPHFLTGICKKALAAGIETEYVCELIRKRNLVPSEPPLEIEDWPWPLRIYTLGRFEIVTEKGPVTFSGKVQQKPLAMLKTLIALGGRAIPEEQITDILWPDAEGDLAHKSFETTLYRLRLLIGNDRAVRLKEGLLSLDPGHCWVDIWAFERLTVEAKSMLSANNQPGEKDRLAAMTEKAFALYRGHFLYTDSDSLGAAPLRERLRNKFAFLITGYCECLVRDGEWEKAVRVLYKALESDNLAEQFYLYLMTCYHKLGLELEALRAYDLCCSALAQTCIKPSAKTEAIRAELSEVCNKFISKPS